MANYSSIKATIDTNIRANNNQEITGPVLNSLLTQMLNELGMGYLTAYIRSLFQLHMTHRGDGVYTPNDERNAIVSPIQLPFDVTITREAGYMFAVQVFDGYETGSSHLVSATGWLFQDYTITAGTYWCMIVANTGGGATTEETNIHFSFYGNDGRAILDRFNDADQALNDKVSELNQAISAQGEEIRKVIPLSGSRPKMGLGFRYQSASQIEVAWNRLYSPLYEFAKVAGVYLPNDSGQKYSIVCWGASDAYLGTIGWLNGGTLMSRANILAYYPATVRIGMNLRRDDNGNITPGESLLSVILINLTETFGSTFRALEREVKGEILPEEIIQGYYYNSPNVITDPQRICTRLYEIDSVPWSFMGMRTGTLLYSVNCFDSQYNYLGNIGGWIDGETTSVAEILSAYPTAAFVGMNMRKKDFSEISPNESELYFMTDSDIWAAIRDIENDMSDEVTGSLIKSKFVLHMTHGGDGTYGERDTRNAIIHPIAFPYAVTVKIAAGGKYAIQYFNTVEGDATTENFESATGWLTGQTVIAANQPFGMIVANTDESVTTEATTERLIITTDENVGGQVKSLFDYSEQTFVKKNDVALYPRTYIGEPLNFSRVYSRNQFESFVGLGWNQSAAYYGDYAIFFNNQELVAYLFKWSTQELLATLSVPHGSHRSPHCNVASVGVAFASSNSIMPLIYISEWDYDGDKACFVYDLTLSGGTYALRLHQYIKFSGISQSFVGVGYMDMVVDAENNLIYTLSYKTTDPYNGDNTMVAVFDLPDATAGTLTDGEYVVEMADSAILNSFQLRALPVRQDAKCNGGMIILACGMPNYQRHTHIVVIDPLSESIITEIPLGMDNLEPESLLIVDRRLLITYGGAVLWEISTY